MTFQKVMGVLAVLACSESVHIHSQVLSSQEWLKISATRILLWGKLTLKIWRTDGHEELWGEETSGQQYHDYCIASDRVKEGLT